MPETQCKPQKAGLQPLSVAVQPGSYTADLAIALNNLFPVLGGTRRRSRSYVPDLAISVYVSLRFIEESVKLQRQLVAVHRDHTPWI
ncbi:uncharacterized protein EI90DRAFT_3117854 [Cantharellus anzutake]|uniref:uncharacterized protein n=1 Tax=Cantharellus anzutake TaxID=1750568 RepID=UPI0019055E7A|nr:uncharacterized protein EI90DRAFT_3117854 [Cantharellus anzutake]KAF8338774.1 hypothetical protein EI90DRAFT_3117854 [Cantharellus anzutake]